MSQALLRKILDRGAQVIKRYRALVRFLDQVRANEPDLADFYLQNFEVIFEIFEQALQYMDAQVKSKKGNRPIGVNDTLALLKLLHGFPRFNADAIASGWNQSALDTFIEVFLDARNDVRIRQSIFQFVCQMIDIKNEAVETKYIDLVNSTLSYKSFPGCAKIALPYYDVKRPPEIFRIARASSQDRHEDSLEFFRLLFDVIRDTEHFGWWWEFLKEHIIRILFPSETIRILHLRNAKDNIGFLASKPPWQIYILLFDLLHHCFRYEDRRDILYASDEDIQLLLMLFEKSFEVLEAEGQEGSIETLKRAMSAYEGWLCVDEASSPTFFWQDIFENQKEFYYRLLVTSAMKSITIFRGTEEVFGDDIEMAYQLLSMLRFFATKPDLSDPFKSFIMKSLRDCYDCLQAREREGQKYDRDLCATLERNFVREIYIYYVAIHPDIYTFAGDWKAFSDLVRRYFEENSIYDFWNSTLMNLSNSIILNVFGLPPEFVGVYEPYRVDVTRHVRQGRRAVVEKTEDAWEVPLELFDAPGMSDVILQLYHIFLSFYGSESTRLYSAKIHAQKIRTLREIIKLFLNVSNLKVPVPAGQPVPHSPEGNTLLDLFQGPLLEGCLRDDMGFLYGRIDAYMSLCFIFSMSKYCVEPFKKEYLANFYHVLLRGLADRTDTKIVDAIVHYSWNIFSFDYPGCHILIPAYIRACIAVIDRSKNDEELNLCARKCLNSLIPVLYFYDELEIGTLDRRLRDKVFLIAELREELFEFYEAQSKIEMNFSSVETLILWGLYYFVLYEIDRAADVRKIIRLIMDSLLSSSNEVWITAQDIITSLAQMKLIAKMDMQTIRELVREIGVKVLQLKIVGYDNPSAVVSLVYTLLEVMIEIPFEFFIESKDFPALIFKTIVSLMELDNVEIRAAASVLLTFALNFLNQFPLPSGSAVISSGISEFDFLETNERGGVLLSSKVHHYAFDKSHLYSVIELDDDDRAALLVVRDCTGRYVWRIRAVTTGDDVSFPLRSPLPLPEVTYVGSGEVEEEEVEEEGEAEERNDDSFDPAIAPVHNERIDTNHVDMVHRFLDFTDTTYGQAVDDYKRNAVIPVEEQEIIRDEVMEELEVQATTEREHIEAFPPEQFHDAVQPPMTRDETWPFGRCFLGDLGLYDPSFKSRFLRLNHHVPNFYRKLKHLDEKKVERETIKVAVVYVQNGQEGEGAIFRNSQGSPLFMEFVQGLGWEIDLATHRGFMGGLSPEGETGVSTHYFANSTTELIFHISTYMPTSEGDLVQVGKKRHIGNDWIHVVWSEHDRDYRSWTIESQFNYANIVIYPLRDPLFRIDVTTKPGVPLLGPLQESMIVDKKVLAPLVRQTAINANKVVRYMQPGYKKCYLTRKDTIDELVEEHGHEVDSSEAFFSYVLQEELPEPFRAVAPKQKKAQPTTTSSAALLGPRAAPSPRTGGGGNDEPADASAAAAAASGAPGDNANGRKPKKSGRSGGAKAISRFISRFRKRSDDD